MSHRPKNLRDGDQILDKEKAATEPRATSTATCDVYMQRSIRGPHGPPRGVAEMGPVHEGKDDI